jgi:hypothetical protein
MGLVTKTISGKGPTANGFDGTPAKSFKRGIFFKSVF